MVAHGQMTPVGHEGVVRTTEHNAHIGGMVNGRVEVGVVTDLGRQVQAYLRLGDNGTGKRNGFLDFIFTEENL